MDLVFTQHTYLQFLSYPHNKPRQPQMFLCTCQSCAAPNHSNFPSLIASRGALPAPAHTQHSYIVASSVEDLTGQWRGHTIQAFRPCSHGRPEGKRDQDIHSSGNRACRLHSLFQGCLMP